MSYYYVPIPEIPKKYLYQDKKVILIKYFVKEKQFIERGTSIALIENDHATFEVSSNGRGFIAELLCNPGELIKVENSIARIRCDGEDIPYNKSLSILKILEEKSIEK